MTVATESRIRERRKRKVAERFERALSPWVRKFQGLHDKAWDIFEKDPTVLPSLNMRPGKQKAMYKARRQACAALGRANGKFINVETLQIGYPCPRVPLGTRYRTQKERAAVAGMNLTRISRAERDMAEPCYDCYKRVTVTKEDGFTKRGRAWAKRQDPIVYRATGVWKGIEECQKEVARINREKREAVDEAGKAQVKMVVRSLSARHGRPKPSPSVPQTIEEKEEHRQKEIAAVKALIEPKPP